MGRLFIARADAVYPASPADYRKAKAGNLAAVRWASVQAGVPVEAPYPEIIGSWLANGFEEVTAE